MYNGRGKFSNSRSIMLVDANAAENRKKFFMQFEIYLVAKGKDDKVYKLKVNMLLHCTGLEEKSTVILCLTMKKTKMLSRCLSRIRGIVPGCQKCNL